MSIIDKIGAFEKIGKEEKVVLELGCGDRKRIKDSIGIDILDHEAVDIIGDVLEVLDKIPDASIDEIHSNHFFEHVEDLSNLMNQVARVMKEGGRLEVVVPHFSNPYFFSDYTHKNFFGLYTFSYLAKDSLFKRKVHNYTKTMDFELCSVYLFFKSPPPFYFRYGFKKMLQFLFNMNNYMREFYEENLCYFFPCYEIKYSLRKIKKVSL